MLILAATPIGNIEDASPRLVRVLRESDLVFAEDTRRAGKLFEYLKVDRTARSFHDHSGEAGLERIAGELTAGKSVVYISDAGMPGINDPGYELVQLARRLDVDVDVIPGPSAVINALVLSGLPTHQFCFMGFFPVGPEKRRTMLDRLQQIALTAVFFEGPSRIESALAFLEEHIPTTPVAVCRELTKIHQQVIQGTPAEVRAKLEMVKGEFCLVVAPIEERQGTSPLERYQQLLDAGNPPARAVKQLSKELRLPKREVYALVHGLEDQQA